MRIVSGELSGRTFDSPAVNRTHPMSEKVRGALFNALGDISDLTVLDAFAGSGALSFEAISRGANSSVAIDIEKNVITVVTLNAQKLNILNKVKAIRANVSSWSDNNPELQFDLVLCDPPYNKINPDLLNKVAAHAKVNGLVVLSLPPSISNLLPLDKYKQLAIKSYGDAQLIFYRKLSD